LKNTPYTLTGKEKVLRQKLQPNYDDLLLTCCGFRCWFFHFAMDSHTFWQCWNELGSSTPIYDTILRCDPLFVSSRQLELWTMKGTFLPETNFSFHIFLLVKPFNFTINSVFLVDQYSLKYSTVSLLLLFEFSRKNFIIKFWRCNSDSNIKICGGSILYLLRIGEISYSIFPAILSASLVLARVWMSDMFTVLSPAWSWNKAPEIDPSSGSISAHSFP
jgi:hypothetical protein